MVANLFESVDSVEGASVGLLAFGSVVGRQRQFGNTLVHSSLQICHGDAHHLGELGREMLGEQSVGSPKNKHIDNLRELGGLSTGPGNLLVTGVGLSATENWVLVETPKLVDVAQNAGVAKIDHGKKLFQIVLHGCA